MCKVNFSTQRVVLFFRYWGADLSVKNYDCTYNVGSVVNLLTWYFWSRILLLFGLLELGIRLVRRKIVLRESISRGGLRHVRWGRFRENVLIMSIDSERNSYYVQREIGQTKISFANLCCHTSLRV